MLETSNVPQNKSLACEWWLRLCVHWIVEWVLFAHHQHLRLSIICCMPVTSVCCPSCVWHPLLGYPNFRSTTIVPWTGKKADTPVQIRIIPQWGWWTLRVEGIQQSKNVSNDPWCSGHGANGGPIQKTKLVRLLGDLMTLWMNCMAIFVSIFYCWMVNCWVSMWWEHSADMPPPCKCQCLSQSQSVMRNRPLRSESVSSSLICNTISPLLVMQWNQLQFMKWNLNQQAS